MTYKKVEYDDSFVRDTRTNALLNTDSDKYNQYLERRKKIKQRAVAHDEGIAALRQEVNELRKLIEEIAQRVK